MLAFSHPLASQIVSVGKLAPSIGIHSLCIQQQQQQLNIRKTSTMTSRRTKTMREQKSSSSDDNNNNNSMTDQKQTILTPLYRGVSMLHIGQISLALKKSGVTLGCLNVIGGPLMAAGLLLLLSNAAEQKHLAKDTFLRLNGLMVLYATLTLGLVALVPQLSSTYGLLYFVSGSSALFVAVKGYFAGLRAADDVTTFWQKTGQLLKQASRTSMSLPSGKSSLGHYCTLWLVAVRKISLLWGIFQVVMPLVSPALTSFVLPASPRRAIALKLSEFIKLTLLGGSVVTTISMSDDDDDVAYDQKFAPINLLASYALGTMAAFGIAKRSTPFEIGEACLLAICAISSAWNGIPKPRHDKKTS
mmetsp:Transcript_17404/g.25240  ORF Transcript_17404/g.25240 Transcript_17404/m.25240 type:complete len:359 (+) Transcript_17404:91-1167(+)